MKYKLYQIQLTNDEVKRANAGEYIPRVAAWRNLLMGDEYKPEYREFYEHVATIEAENLDEVFEFGNIGPESKIERHSSMHSVSVGDIIVDENGAAFMVLGIGFGELSEFYGGK